MVAVTDRQDYTAAGAPAQFRERALNPVELPAFRGTFR